ncbi:Cyclin pch1 [Golovinomyces cichoracearum]|uniref:RNA polymerase II holoenzyme cyclin-like subunit n=1 Tax=Golovinomyces cichoracearum TaxID=62708 RepID=A0A420I620_9PEZI|nr:Cyclin pch1 [Golovinomyces cichoracearum]
MKNLDLDTNSGTSGSDISLKDIPRSTDAPPESSEPRVRQRNDVRRPDSRHSTMAVETSDQWIFTPEEVMSAPCIVDGLDPVEERCRRAKGVNFITQAGILLKLPQLTIATASIFFHRYFMRQTMVVEKGGAHHYNVAATALFLATKTEENCRKTREIVVAVAKVAQKNSSLVIDEQSKEYWRWRDSILYLEEHMLEMLTFDLVVNTPHINLLGLLETLAIEENKSLRNAAWAFLNDSCMTPLCLMMPGPDITIAAVYFAVKLNNETLPDVDNKPWWLSVGGDPEKIVRAVSVVDQFWTENPLRKSDRPYGSSPSSQDDLERTRRRESNGSSSGDNFSEDRLVENCSGTVCTPQTHSSTKSQEPSSDTLKQTNQEEDGLEKRSVSESESSLKNETGETKTSTESTGPQNQDLHKLSIESDGDGDGDTAEQENEASNPDSDESRDSHNAPPSASDSNTISSPSKRRLSDDRTDEPERKRIKTEELSEEV